MKRYRRKMASVFLCAGLLLVPSQAFAADLWSESWEMPGNSGNAATPGTGSSNAGSGTSSGTRWSDGWEWDWQTGTGGGTNAGANNGTGQSSSSNDWWSNWDWNWQTGNPAVQQPAQGGTQTGGGGTTGGQGSWTDGWDWNWQTGNPAVQQPAQGGTQTGGQTGQQPGQGGTQPGDQTGLQPLPIRAFNPPAGMQEIELHRPAFVKDGTVVFPVEELMQKAYSIKMEKNYWRGYFLENGKELNLGVSPGQKFITLGEDYLGYAKESGGLGKIPLSQKISVNKGCDQQYMHCWYGPLDLLNHFGEAPNWIQEEKVVTLGSRYYFKVQDDPYTKEERKTLNRFIGKWTVYSLNPSDLPSDIHGTLEIRDDFTMVWDDLLEINRGRWDLDAKDRSVIYMTNGLFKYGWYVKYRMDGNLKIYGHGMTFIGYKQVDPVQTGYTPPQGVREIPIEAPAYFEDGELYISLGTVHYLGGQMEEMGSQVYIYNGSSNMVVYQSSAWVDANTIAKVKGTMIDGVYYVPADELLNFFILPYSVTANNQILLINNELFVRIGPKPQEP